MNREIKFRAWHSGMKRIVPCSELVSDQMSLLANGNFANPDPYSTDRTKIFSHNEMTPMQFTGLHDRTGKKIYEGDILEWTWYGVGQGGGTPARDSVEWHSHFWKLSKETGCAFGATLASVAEVIGNIYENPDLVSPARHSNSETGEGDSVVNEQTASLA